MEIIVIHDNNGTHITNIKELKQLLDQEFETVMTKEKEHGTSEARRIMEEDFGCIEPGDPITKEDYFFTVFTDKHLSDILNGEASYHRTEDQIQFNYSNDKKSAYWWIESELDAIKSKMVNQYEARHAIRALRFVGCFSEEESNILIDTVTQTAAWAEKEAAAPETHLKQITPVRTPRPEETE